jgi:hypothetical protein
MWWVEAMSDSPPERDLEMQRRPTRSAPSVWKYCLVMRWYVSGFGFYRFDGLGCWFGEDVLGVCAVDAHFILLRGIFAEVFDVA